MKDILELLNQLRELSITLKLESGQLKINAPKGKMTPELLRQLKERKPEIIGFLSSIDKEKRFASVQPVEDKEYYPLSSAQKRLYIMQKLDPLNVQYNMPIILPLQGEFDTDTLRRVIGRLIQRHESFRTSFCTINGQPVQRIHDVPGIRYHTPVHHIGEPAEQLKQLFEAFIRPFDLENAPLFRVEIACTQDHGNYLIMDIHHIISDEVSRNTLTREFAQLYAEPDRQLPFLKLRCRDFACHQEKQRQSGALAAQETFWKERFADGVPVLELPLDFPRPPVMDFAGDSVVFTVALDTAEQLRQPSLRNFVSGESGVTMYMVVLALLYIVLSKTSGSEDIVVGTPVSGRNHADLEPVIGMFVNTLALRDQPRGNFSFIEFLDNVNKHCLSAFENQDFQFEDLVEQLLDTRETGRNPLFDVMYTYQTRAETAGAEREPGEDDSEGGNVAKFDLTFVVSDSGSQLDGHIQYRTTLFKKETVRRLAGFFTRAASIVAQQPDILISGIEIIGPEEKQQLLNTFNDTASDLPIDRPLIAFIEDRAQQTPDAVMVTGPLSANEKTLTATATYNEINGRANQLAAVLSENGVGPETIAAVMLNRSLDMTVALLAIWKAGGAYLPIDPSLPEERTRYILDDSGAKLIIVDPGHRRDRFITCPSCPAIPIDNSQSSIVNRQVTKSEKDRQANHLAYIIYTSGTTGRPKGVMIENRGLTNAITWRKDFYKLNSSDVVLQLFSFSFDGFVTSFFTPLIAGSHVVLASGNEAGDASRLRNIVANFQVSHFIAVPSLYDALLDAAAPGQLKSLRTITLAGEATTRALVEKSRQTVPHTEIVNEYGATENTVVATALSNVQPRPVIPIGKPIANTRIYILDRYRQPTPIGIAGEINISGPGIARGYLNNVALTALKFFATDEHRPKAQTFTDGFISKKGSDIPGFINHQSSFITFYRTGDKGRWLDDGNIEFLGRIDMQVKIRGYRIELGEIERRLEVFEEVTGAVVAVKERGNGEKYLCAYLVTGDDTDVTVIKEKLALELPAYMIPSHFELLDRLPLTTGGKVDRKALPEPGDMSGEKEYIAPSRYSEFVMVKIWAGVLGITPDKISIDANFFQLGGHSLAATRMIAGIEKELGVTVPLAQVFQAPTIGELCRYIDSREGAKAKDAPVPVEKKEYYPLSSAQNRLYMLFRMEPSVIAYNMPQIIPIPVSLDKTELTAICRQLIQRHESFRTSFHMVDGEPVQRVHENVDFSVDFSVPVYHCDDGSPGEIQKINREFVRPFDLSTAPLLRVAIICLPGETHLLATDMHHIISDGVSRDIMTREVQALLNREALPPVPLQYKDYACWQNNMLTGGDIQPQESFWLEQFGGEIPVLQLPLDFPRPRFQRFEGNNLPFVLPPGVSQSLRALALQEDCTVYMVVLALFTALLGRCSGQEDIVVGTPVAGRRHADVQSIVGMFVQTLALRNQPEPGKLFSHFLQEVKTNTVNGFENQDYPFETLVEKVMVNRDTGRNPLFDVMFSFHTQETIVATGQGQPGNENIDTGFEGAQPGDETPGISKFDITFNVFDSGDRLSFNFQYAVSLFKPQTIQRFAVYFKRLAAAVTADPGTPLAELDIIPDEEKQLLLNTFNETDTDLPTGRPLIAFIEDRAQQTPDAVMVTGPLSANGETLTTTATYKEINGRANQLAAVLSENGVGPETIAAVMLNRSLDMTIALLAIWKTGGAYLPIDPSLPEERIRYILEDSRAGFVLATDRHRLEHDLHRRFFCLKDGGCEPLEHVGAAREFEKRDVYLPAVESRLAYIIYTSGTTGRPKGVMIENRGLTNAITWRKDFYKLCPSDVVLQLFSFSFDGFVTSFFTPLIAGSHVILAAENEAGDASRLRNILANYQVSHFIAVPSLYDALLDAANPDQLKSLRVITLAGEAMPQTLVEKSRQTLPHLEIVNEYGATENTVVATAYPNVQSQPIIPIGKPIANTRIYILDPNRRPTPIGITGEICITGPGIARGYLNRPELTAKRFINHEGKEKAHSSWLIARREEKEKKLTGANELSFPTSYELRATSFLYITGDKGRWLDDGNIEFLGRIDMQVKVRGYRIELGEIEARLEALEGVTGAAVTVRERGDRDNYLCAYLAAGESVDVEWVKEKLARDLPAYMIPSHFVLLDGLPLTSGGKVNRKALPEPGEIVPQEEYCAPSRQSEFVLVKIWAGVLGIEEEKISTTANFFQLGGHSLAATRMIARIEKELGIAVPLTQVFQAPTIGELGRFIDSREGTKTQGGPVPVEKKEYYPLSSAQNRLFMLYRMEPLITAYNMPQIIPFPFKPDEKELTSICNQLIQRHESFRTSFHMVNGEPVQRVHDSVDFSVAVYHSDAGSQREIEEINRRFIRPFDLSGAPLLRVAIISLPGETGVVATDMHHIISDGVSRDIMTREVQALLNREDLPAVGLQYKDFACWQNNRVTGGQIQMQESYWLEQFQGETPVLQLPLDFPRPRVQRFDGNRVPFKLPPDISQSLKELALKEDCTVYMVLLALFNTLLGRCAGQDDIVVGTPVAGRRHADVQAIIGMFVQTLALRNQPEPGKTFSHFLHEVKTNTVEAFENQDYPFETLVEKVMVNRDTGRNPLFDVMFSFNTRDGGETAVSSPSDGQEELMEEAGETVAKFDLTLSAADNGNYISCSFEYAVHLFKPGTIKRWAGYFVQLAREAVLHPLAPMAELDMLPPEEKEMLIDTFNAIEVPFSNDKTLVQLFGEQVERTPGKVAVVELIEENGEETQKELTYAQLNAAASHISNRLIQLGAGHGSIIGLIIDRSIDMAAAILGILQTGAAYLPIDPEAPDDRIVFMLNDSAAQLLITGPGYRRRDRFPTCPSIIIENSQLSINNNQSPGIDNRRLAPRTSPLAASLAYIIYTSGTTGKPKGVPITHANLSPLLHWGYKHLEMGTGERSLQNLSYYFDWSVWEIFITLTGGGRLYFLPKHILLNPIECIRVMNEHRVSVLHATPTQYRYYAETGIPLQSLRYLFLGAEKLDFDLVNRSLELIPSDCRIFNMYGPTEATIISAVLEIDRHQTPQYPQQAVTSIPIGRTAGNTVLLVLDNNLRLSPLRTTGELYIAGDGVAKGYLNRPELTNERFVLAHSSWLIARREEKEKKLSGSNELSFPTSYELRATSCLYKTGDLVRWLEDGNIEYLGRIDQQVKIRGYRIELGEIEARLLVHEAIREAVVIDREGVDGEKYLCAYLVAVEHDEKILDGDFPGTAGLKEFLARDLPGYMIPSYFITLPALPLNANGKLDRKALPEPAAAVVEKFAAPEDETELRLVDIWSEVLDVDKTKLSVTANFFETGGHSLKAAVLAAKIRESFDIEIPVTEIFISPTIRQLAGFIKSTSPSGAFVRIPYVEEKEYYVLSSAQKRMFFLQQMEPGGVVYNIPSQRVLDENVDIESLQEAFRLLIQRHQVFRTSFHEINGQPVQRIHDTVDFSIPVYEAAYSENIPNPVRPFDLSRAPLLRAMVIRMPDGLRLLAVDMHHIVSDGVSSDIMTRELRALLNRDALPPVPLQYKDYASWQYGRLHSGLTGPLESYWLEQFDDGVPVLQLPVDFPRPRVQRFEGNRLPFMLSPDVSRSLRELALRENCTVYMLLLALFTALLGRCSGQDDIVVGTPVAGRDHVDLQSVIGMFVETLVLRNRPEPAKTFSQFLQEVRTNTLDAFANQDYPFENLVEKVMVNRDTGRNPLFDVMFSFHTREIFSIREDGQPGNEGNESNESNEGNENIDPEFEEAQRGDEPQGISKFDITFSAFDGGERLFFNFQYAVSLFKPETINRFAGYFKRLAEAVLIDPGTPVSKLDIIPGEEKQRLLETFNDSTVDFPQEKCLHQLFREQVQKTPDHTAVTFTSKAGLKDVHYITYRHLDHLSEAFAVELNDRGIGSGDIVALMVDRSIEMAAGMLGILKAGAAYMPISPGYPDDRVKYMLEDSGAVFIFTAKGNRSYKSGMAFTPVRSITQSPSALAYVIYTSGTTGRPKGVMIEHRSAVNVTSWFARSYHVTTGTRVLQMSDFTFDASVNQIFGPLLYGGVLNIVSRELMMDIPVLRRYIDRQQVNIVNFVPRFLHELLAGGPRLESLSYVISGAEKLDHTYKDRLLNKGYRLINHYGPTESTIDTLAWECAPGPVTLGKPIANTQCYILDNTRALLPIGAAGELYISGAGIARGYLNRPGLTAERFPEIDLLGGMDTSRRFLTFYRTGDRVRWLPDGNMEFLGRMDRQVKIRGFRIELEEIENRIKESLPVEEAVVVVGEAEGYHDRLTAYVVACEPGDSGISQWRGVLGSVLPEYMIPSHLVVLETMPMTPGGKIDRKALPEPGLDESAGELVLPGNDTQQKLQDIWSGILDLESGQIGIDADFFQLGGHSLKAAMMAAKIRKEFDVEIPMTDIFTSSTIRQLSGLIVELTPGPGLELSGGLLTGNEEYYPEYYSLSPAQRRIFILHQMEPEGTAFNICTVRHLTNDIDLEKLEKAFQTLIRRHEAFRTSFRDIDGQPVQYVHEHFDFTLDIREIPTFEGIAGFMFPFDLNKAPLIRASVLKPATGQPLLMVETHHIISDLESHQILAREIDFLMSGGVLPDVPPRYVDYAARCNQELESEEFEIKQAYWLMEFSDDIPVLEIPADYPRPVIQSHRGGSVFFHIAGENYRGLRELAEAHNASLFHVLLAAYHILLARLTGQDDIVIGTPADLREQPGLEQVIGLFVNTLPLRNIYDRGESFKEFLADVRDTIHEAFEHREFPFAELVEQLSVNRDTGRNPLFDVMFSFREAETYFIEEETGARFDLTSDLTFNARDNGDSISCVFQYAAALFKKETVTRWANHFRHLTGEIVRSPGIPMARLDIMTPEEKTVVLRTFNDTGDAYTGERTLTGLFQRQVDEHPDRVALAEPYQTGCSSVKEYGVCMYLSYRELNKQAEILAAHLMSRGAGPGSIVAIMFNRSFEMMIGIWGVLKSGAAYLPLDPGAPADRIDFITRDSSARLLLISTGILEKDRLQMLGGTVEHLNVCFAVVEYKETGMTPIEKKPLADNDPAYVIYTSGTTGNPKGVVVEHRNVTAYLHAFYREFDLSCGDSGIQLVSYTFDVFIEEVFPILLRGGKIVIPPPGNVPDIDLTTGLMVREHVTILNCTPVLLNEFNRRAELLKPLRYIISGGDILKYEYIDRLCRLGTVYNTYGPTESTVCSTYYRYAPGDASIFLGKPVTNYSIFILDQDLQPVPIGVTGEICIAGPGIARGYLNRPELTAKKFRSTSLFINHQSSLINLYLSGDLGCWMPSGDIRFMGRKDCQVKIHGYRIELEEIEHRLAEIPGIYEAVVIDRTSNTGEKYLCAYVILEHPGSELPDLKSLLKKTLPDYMIPLHFIAIENIPVTANGKVDRKALPEPGETGGRSFVSPEGELETQLTRTWAGVLDLEPEGISVTDNFFDLGGDSLKAYRAVTGINHFYRIEMPLVQLFTNPTIRGLKSCIRDLLNKKSGIADGVTALKRGIDPSRHLFFVHDGTGEVEGYIEFCKYLDPAFNAWGLRFDRLTDMTPVTVTANQLAEQYIERMKTIQPQGPYYLAGWSLGGTIVFEMARQLEKENEHVAFVSLIDTVPPGGFSQDETVPFDLATETAFLREIVKTDEARAFLKNASDFNLFWPSVADFLKQLDVDMHTVRQVIRQFGMQALPNFDQLDLQESIYYLNVARSLRNACLTISPGQTLNAPVHFFKASESSYEPGQWQTYCANPIDLHIIDGDHRSIFRPPLASSLAARFNRVINDVF